MPNTVIVTREPPIAVVQLNRPEVLNALNEEVLDELVRALTALDDDDAIRCIVLTGSEKAFAAGADIKESFVTATPVSMLEQDLTTRWEGIRRIKTPIVAAGSGDPPRGGSGRPPSRGHLMGTPGARVAQAPDHLRHHTRGRGAQSAAPAG